MLAGFRRGAGLAVDYRTEWLRLGCQLRLDSRADDRVDMIAWLPWTRADRHTRYGPGRIVASSQPIQAIIRP